MHDIFLSYAGADRERVRPLARRLEEHGWSVWWDQQVQPGESFADVIESALDQSRTVVVVWSRHSVGSYWVKMESQRGAERGTLIPILLDDVEAPSDFGRLQQTDLRGWDGSEPHPEFDRLISALRHRLGQPEVEDDRLSPTAPSGVSVPTPDEKPPWPILLPLILALLLVLVPATLPQVAPGLEAPARLLDSIRRRRDAFLLISAGLGAAGAVAVLMDVWLTRHLARRIVAQLGQHRTSDD